MGRAAVLAEVTTERMAAHHADDRTGRRVEEPDERRVDAGVVHRPRDRAECRGRHPRDVADPGIERRLGAAGLIARHELLVRVEVGAVRVEPQLAERWEHDAASCANTLRVVLGQVTTRERGPLQVDVVPVDLRAAQIDADDERTGERAQARPQLLEGCDDRSRGRRQAASPYRPRRRPRCTRPATS